MQATPQIVDVRAEVHQAVPSPETVYLDRALKMKNGLYTKAEEIGDVSIGKPHVVILGAGASCAACPNGDKNGVKLPVMSDLIDMLGLSGYLDRAGVKHKGMNFEAVYGAICEKPEYREITHKVEKTVSEYFRRLELPDEPTIYDHLVMSLRKKDVIATFNWDPFLYQALERNHGHTRLPHFFFLHGCAIVGYCQEHLKQGRLSETCPTCNRPFTATNLLYPVANKDYVSDPYISRQWQSLKVALSEAFLLTIFGYGAPVTDAAAVDLMSEAWGTPEKRRFDRIEIIDVLNEDQLVKRWKSFVYSWHYNTGRDFYASLIANHPRRSCEVMYQCLFNARFSEANPIPRFSSFPDMWNWFRPLFEHEQ